MASTTRERLVSVGADLFYQQGFQAVGLDRILDEVGITKTAFYKHFESKDELIVAVLEHRDQVDMSEWNTFFRERGSEDPKCRLLAVFDLLDDWFGRANFRGCLFMNAATEFPSPNDPIHQMAERHSANIYQELRRFSEASGARDADALAKQVMLLMTGAISARHAGGDPDAAAVAKGAAELLIERHCAREAVKARR